MSNESKLAGASGPRASAEAAAAGAGNAGWCEIADTLGRALLLRELDVLEEQFLIALVGEPFCLNRLYMARVLEACRIAAIDAEPVEFPHSQAQLRALFMRLGREGLEAIMWHSHDVHAARTAASRGSCARGTAA